MPKVVPISMMQKGCSSSDLRHAHWLRLRRYLPTVLKHVHFEASPAGKPVVQAYDWLRDNIHGTKPAKDAPKEVIRNAWQRT